MFRNSKCFDISVASTKSIRAFLNVRKVLLKEMKRERKGGIERERERERWRERGRERKGGIERERERERGRGRKKGWQREGASKAY